MNGASLLSLIRGGAKKSKVQPAPPEENQPKLLASDPTLPQSDEQAALASKERKRAAMAAMVMGSGSALPQYVEGEGGDASDDDRDGTHTRYGTVGSPSERFRSNDVFFFVCFFPVSFGQFTLCLFIASLLLCLLLM